MLLRYKIEDYIPITTLIAEPMVPNEIDINIMEY
jgi:hypothetical protein